MHFSPLRSSWRAFTQLLVSPFYVADVLSGKGHTPQRWGEIKIIYTSALLERARKVDFNGIRFRQTRFIISHLRPAGSTVIIAFQAMTRPLLRLQMGHGRAPNAITRSAQSHLTACGYKRWSTDREVPHACTHAARRNRLPCTSGLFWVVKFCKLLNQNLNHTTH